MKAISAALEAHYARETTTISTCWKATLRNGTVYGFTDCSHDLVIDGVTYIASSGHNSSAIESSSSLNVDNLEVGSILSDDSILETDLQGGLWDYAAISLFEVNYKDLTMGKNPMRDGYLGQVSSGRNSFIAELRGLMQAFQQPTGRAYGPLCDATFCDTRCTLSAATWSGTGIVVSLASNRQLNVTLSRPALNYVDGLITMTSGAANTMQMEIKAQGVGVLTLQELFPIAPAPGDTFTILAGCDHLVTTCNGTYANVVNFRGFPDLPGQDRMVVNP